MPDQCTPHCGTGTGSGPVAGDPNFDVSVFATPVFGGIQVGWSFPTTNPAAVAHTQVYRSNSSDPVSASQLAVAAGSTFFDQLNVTVPTTYYYWVRIVSIQGTVGDMMGPASAIAKPRGQSTVEDLGSGGADIDESLLGTELRTQIGKITLTYDELRQEILDRIGANNAFAAALNATNGQLTNALTLIAQEEQQRVDGQAALVSRMDMLAAINNDNAAAIIHEAELRLAADSAAASEISALYTATGDTAAAVVNETNARTAADSSLASQISALYTATGDTAAAVVNETNARTAADSSLASQINTVQSTLGNQIASVQTNAQTQIDATNNKVNALWTVKVQAGSNPPRIAGIGLTNDGTTADFGIIADRFWFDTPDGVGRVKPFVIENNTVYIENAVIKNLNASHIGSNAITNVSAGVGDAYSGPASAYIQPDVACPIIAVASISGNPVIQTFEGWTSYPARFKSRIVVKNGGTGAVITQSSWFHAVGSTSVTLLWNSPALAFTWMGLEFVSESDNVGLYTHMSSSICLLALKR